VTDQRSARNGSVIEEIGTYDPMKDPPDIKINEESAVKWLKNGAQPSDAVAHMLTTRGITAKVAASA
jgi:small subunit ribosomal protein S16